MPPSTSSFHTLPLEGTCNFRDLGGYPAAGGRHVRSGVLFRSASLTHLTPNDHQQLGGLGIKVICDLRRADEATHEPTRWGTAVMIRQWPLDEATAHAQRARDWLGDGDEQAILEMMEDNYRTMPRWLKPHVRGIFALLQDGDVPLLFHCAAGKDRTGFVASLLLHALGVPDDVVMEDYLLTNAAGLYEFTRRHRKSSVGIAGSLHLLDHMAPRARDCLLGAHERYLRTAHAAIRETHSSKMAYLEDVTGLTARDFEALRERLCTEDGRD